MFVLLLASFWLCPLAFAEDPAPQEAAIVVSTRTAAPQVRSAGPELRAAPSGPQLVPGAAAPKVSSSSSTVAVSTQPLPGSVWDPKALLPDSLIVTYYGNPFSKHMGILGQLDPQPMMDRLAKEAEQWQLAISSTAATSAGTAVSSGTAISSMTPQVAVSSDIPALAISSITVRPGLELVADVASVHPEADGLYHQRMPNATIDKVIGWARSRGWLTILDVQTGHSTVRKEIDWLRPWLEQPDVHLALDPEFMMNKKLLPGQLIGSADAEDVNVAVIELAKIVEAKKLPPKLLFVYRFTDNMLRRRRRIRLDPRVQIVIVMDGHSDPGNKKTIYRREITRQPVQFAGIKLFYRHDKPLMTKEEVLKLQPRPSVIVYQ